MIGVIADENEIETVKEFFELFKTPWERCQVDRCYPVVLSSSPAFPVPEAGLAIIYGLDAGYTQGSSGQPEQLRRDPTVLSSGGKRFPVYCGFSTLRDPGKAIITREDTCEAVGVVTYGSEGKRVRIGFDLFQEILFLLTVGQPAEHAMIPTLEMHISILRNLIVDSGLPLAEILPVPPGYEYILCLTHDVDFASIRLHKADRTVMGFIYRASIGSLVRFVQRQLSFGKLLKNLMSLFSLPLVYVHLAKDCFNQFDLYLELEGRLKSTFFLVPYKNVDGLSPEGRDARGRATRYDVGDIGPEIGAVLANGCEVGLHAIDAWHDLPRAKKERAIIGLATKRDPAGVRVHWLYFSELTPAILENAGFTYDATWGYNACVGFRGGTTQVFRPAGAQRLLELPLLIQDTALFSARRMGLSQTEGIQAIEQMLRQTQEMGGVFTINWHMRSVGPEKWWDDPYRYVLRKAEDRSAWTATAGDVVEWFALRRSVRFSEVHLERGAVKISCKGNPKLPGLSLQLYNLSAHDSRKAISIPFSGNLALGEELSGAI